MPVDSLQLDTACYTLHGRRFEVPRRYSVVSVCGVNCAARDTVAGEACAIRKVEGVFEHIGGAKRTLRELRILRHLQHENLVEVRSVFLPGTKGDFKDLYVVSGAMPVDLAAVLRSGQTLSHEQIQFLIYQTLRGLKYVHSAGVVHRFLEPRNLLVNEDCDLRISDFGLARVSFEDEGFQACPATQYVSKSKRWYRAPEVLCSWASYGSAVDVWSVGCIFAEMLLRWPLFPGHNLQRQMELIVALLGTPSSEELDAIPSELCRRTVDALPRSEGGFRARFSEASDETADLLRTMLQFSPRKRATVPQALEHPYMGELFCPEDEPTRDTLEASDFEFQRRKVDIRALREELFQEALRYHPDARQRYVQEQRRLGRRRYSLKAYPLLAPGEPLYSPGEGEEEEEGPKGGAAPSGVEAGPC